MCKNKWKKNQTMQFLNNDIKLFGEAGIAVENKYYTKEKVERLKIKVIDFIMSKNIKDIDKYNKKFSRIL